MFEQTQPVSFFLGANTPSGFVGYLDDLYDAKSGWHAFLIKSGPGTGKNTLIRAVLHAMVALEEPVEAICCSSDPNSLDGLRCPRLKLCILDATAPHIMEPRYWGAGEETVDLCACMRSALLRSDAAEIIRLTDACSAMHARCRSLLRGASVFLNETAQIAAEYTDFSKIVHTADRIAAFTFGRKSAVPGTETRRFLSAVTPEGHVFFEKTIPSLCDTIYSIEDETGAASGVFLSVIREKALQAGYPISHLRLSAQSAKEIRAPLDSLFTSRFYHRKSLASARRTGLPANSRSTFYGPARDARAQTNHGFLSAHRKAFPAGSHFCRKISKIAA